MSTYITKEEKEWVVGDYKLEIAGRHNNLRVAISFFIEDLGDYLFLPPGEKTNIQHTPELEKEIEQLARLVERIAKGEKENVDS